MRTLGHPRHPTRGACAEAGQRIIALLAGTRSLRPVARLSVEAVHVAANATTRRSAAHPCAGSLGAISYSSSATETPARSCLDSSAIRRSELVALDAGHVTETGDGLVVTVPRSKTDQEGEGREIGIPYGSNLTTCPVRTTRIWLQLSKIEDGPLSDRSTVTVTSDANVSRTERSRSWSSELPRRRVSIRDRRRALVTERHGNLRRTRTGTSGAGRCSAITRQPSLACSRSTLGGHRGRAERCSTALGYNERRLTHEHESCRRLPAQYGTV